MIHILIRYLGIKTKLLHEIVNAIEELTPPDKAVLDLFAGSNVVGQALKEKFIVYTNDIQEYSYITAKALIEYTDMNDLNSLNDDSIFTSEFYHDNKQTLLEIFQTPIQYERELLGRLHQYNDADFNDFIELYNHSPFYTDYQNKHASFADCLSYFTEAHIEKYQTKEVVFPYILFSTYYGNPYFSLEQCIEIDSIRYAIDRLYETGKITAKQKDIYLSALLYVLHNIVCSVGDHFAQPQIIQEATDRSRLKINLRERKKIIGKKRLLVQTLFNEKITEIKMFLTNGRIENKAFNEDYAELLSDKNAQILAEIGTVYIDPPYTNAHYSRFYHIPETLVKYDYPDIQFNGRYRTDRYQSNFCIKTKAYEEFDQMLQKCSFYRLNCVISYSNTSQCILEIDDIIGICQKHYQHVNINQVDHMYRNFGQKPNRVTAKEFIISCQI